MGTVLWVAFWVVMTPIALMGSAVALWFSVVAVMVPCIVFEIVTQREQSTAVRWAWGLATTALFVWFAATHYVAE